MFRCRYARSQVRNKSTTSQLEKRPLPGTAYQPRLVEDKYNDWDRRGLFRAGRHNGEVFSMVLPPPNVTGKLHLGHALACTVQDVIVRRQRSLGKDVLWLPGTDHAGIATQGVVEKYLKAKHNTDRRSLGREKFNLEVWKWKERYGGTIEDQLSVLGASLDWSRAVFTMDRGQTGAVNEAFVRLFDAGLIYRREAPVNWCVELKSTISDIEVENFEITSPVKLSLSGYKAPVEFGRMARFAYKVCGSGEEIVVATTRPETMLGDAAVAVHPEDERYKHLHNAMVQHPFREDTLPVIADEFVDMKFGTGAVKITPAHDKKDYEVGQRHNLKMIQVIDENGRMNDNAGQFSDLKRYDCRTAIIGKLNDLGILKKIEDHPMILPRCSRTGDVIEILPKEQWFVSCKDMNKKALDAVQSGKLRIRPENFLKKWNIWTADERDWCISRQLWWGHQIPAYKCCHNEQTVWVAALNENDARNKIKKKLNTKENELVIVRDEDVLDTWFSSGIYPFSSLGWPEKTKDYEKYYPLSLMATGHDILGFWVHRMIILGLELTKKLPFNDVLLHGIICDSKGAKMSKSRGNVIDPVDIINGISLEKLNDKSEEALKTGLLSKEEYMRTKSYNKSNFPNGIPECGVDGLRFTLLTNNIGSHFVNFSVDICHANKLFCNKIWQSIKYMQMSFEKLKPTEVICQEDLNKFDLWILSRLAFMVENVNRSIDNYDFHLATSAIKTLIYSEFCDTYLEITKQGFDGDNIKKAYAHAHTLSAVLNVSLRCLSPIMVYVTSELIPKIPGFENNIIYNFDDLHKDYFDFPKDEDFAQWRNSDVEAEVGSFNDVVSLVRQIKGIYGIPNRIKPIVHVASTDNKISSIVLENKAILSFLTRCSDVCMTDDVSGGHLISAILNEKCKVTLQLENSDENDKLMSSAKEKLSKRVKKIEESIEKVEAKISSDKYISATEINKIADKEKVTKLTFELNELKRLYNGV